MTSIGRLITEEQGRPTVRRLLSVDNGTALVEATFETQRSLRDVPYTTLGTIRSSIRPDGTLHAHTYRGAITFENAVGAFAEFSYRTGELV